MSVALMKRTGITHEPNHFLTVAARKRMEWLEEARPKQILPEGVHPVIIARCGRGFGKTRVGAEAKFWSGAKGAPKRIAVIAPTHGDVRDTCFEGESGLLAVIPSELIAKGGYVRTLSELTLKNGTRYKGYSATEPNRLRGPQHHEAWLDEFAAFEDNFLGCAEETLDMMQFGLRLGDFPEALITTTPKPIDIIKTLERDPRNKVIIGSTYENKDNLPQAFFDKITQYEGTRLGAQEIYAQILDNEDIGIISRKWFKLWPAGRKLPKLEFVLVSFDTAFTEKTIEHKKKGEKRFSADPTACQVYGVFIDVDATPNVILLDLWDEQLGFPELRAKAKQVAATKWFGRKTDLLLIEDKGSGISLRQDLAADKIPTYPYNPGRADKLTRLHLVSHVIKAGRVWLLESQQANLAGKPRTWYEAMLSQVCTFIGEGSIRHDDHVDAMTQALRYCLDHGLIRLAKPTERELNDREARAEAVVQARGHNPYAA